MNGVRMIAILLLLLGVLSFVVPIPQREDHSVKIGNAKIGVQTESNEKLPPVVGIVLVAGGVLVLVLGTRRT
jgi:nucleoside recognition membrane protein YjiH